METSVNNKCRAFTSLEQSKKLAEILPLESADMYYPYVLPKSDKIKHIPEMANPINALKWYNKGYTTFGKESITLNEFCVPCWSLAALLHYLNEIKPRVYTLVLFPIEGKWILQFAEHGHGNVCEVSCDNPNDACYEMILKLHELKML